MDALPSSSAPAKMACPLRPAEPIAHLRRIVDRFRSPRRASYSPDPARPTHSAPGPSSAALQLPRMAHYSAERSLRLSRTALRHLRISLQRLRRRPPLARRRPPVLASRHDFAQSYET